MIRQALVFLLLSLCNFLLPGLSLAEVSLEGELVFVVVDHIEGPYDQTYLKTNQGKRIRIETNDTLSALSDKFSAGDSVTAAGNYNSQGIFTAKSIRKSTARRTISRFFYSKKTPKIATVLVEMNGLKSSCSASEAKEILSTNESSLKAHIEYNSRGSIEPNFDVNKDGREDIFGPIVLGYKEECNIWDWTGEVDDKLKEKGIDLSQYDSVVYVMPDRDKLGLCNFIGFADFDCLGESSCRSTIFGCYPEILVHEFGHNLGMKHASVDYDNNFKSEGEDNYADLSCPMGVSYGANLQAFNAPHQDEMGWLLPEANMIAEVYGSGKLLLSPLDSVDRNVGYTYAIKIPYLYGGYWYLSYRRPIGDFVGRKDFYMNRLSIHRVSGKPGTNTYLMATLAEGERFEDSHSGDVFEVNERRDSSLYVTYRTKHGPDVNKCVDGFSCELMKRNSSCGVSQHHGLDPCRGRNYLKTKRDLNISGKHSCVHLHDGTWTDGLSQCDPRGNSWQRERSESSSSESDSSTSQAGVDNSIISSTNKIIADCIDTDGDGWGWDGSNSCRVGALAPSNNCVDSDGDGWGWNGSSSCQVNRLGLDSDCIDSDGDGWGWDGSNSCRVDNADSNNNCVDTDGDGWGWDGVSSCWAG